MNAKHIESKFAQMGALNTAMETDAMRNMAFID